MYTGGRGLKSIFNWVRVKPTFEFYTHVKYLDLKGLVAMLAVMSCHIRGEAIDIYILEQIKNSLLLLN